MKQVKAEIIDLEYEEEWRKREEDEDALMVARKIKQEFDEVHSPSPQPPPRPVQVIHENHSHNHRQEIERPAAAPLVFDHFICMRIGLNSRNNVQRLMALLAAHEFVDLTVLPGPSMMPPPMPPMMQMGVPHHHGPPPPHRIMSNCPQEASTSNGAAHEIIDIEPKHRQNPHIRIKRNMVKKIVHKPFIRSTPSADCGIIPINMQCLKCDEIIPKGSHGSSALNHVQKNHLKMAAFQCRICKHYRTTQERIQSHVTTVHKAKSTKFDSSLAGPLSEEDMKKMEEMITYCFPRLKMELQVTDRLVAKTMEVDLAGSK